MLADSDHTHARTCPSRTVVQDRKVLSIVAKVYKAHKAQGAKEIVCVKTPNAVRWLPPRK